MQFETFGMVDIFMKEKFSFKQFLLVNCKTTHNNKRDIKKFYLTKWGSM